jgi:hypothetical protein
MALPTWEHLHKNQTDSEQIEDAVARLIAAHEADPEAHLGVGESLQSHRASEIVDHLARSIVRDKLAFDRRSIDEHFATIDSWYKAGDISLQTLGEVKIIVDPYGEDYAVMAVQIPSSLAGAWSPSVRPCWDVRLYIQYPERCKVSIGAEHTDAERGWGFFTDPASTEPHAWCWAVDADGDHWEAPCTGINLGEINTYRCEMDGDNVLHWLVNGAEVASHEYERSDELLNAFMLTVKAVGELATYVWWYQFHYDEEYIYTPPA